MLASLEPWTGDSQGLSPLHLRDHAVKQAVPDLAAFQRRDHRFEKRPAIAGREWRRRGHDGRELAVG